MRKGKEIHRILAALMCASLMLQEMPTDVFAAEEIGKADALECLSEEETGHGEIESLIKEHIEV